MTGVCPICLRSHVLFHSRLARHGWKGWSQGIRRTRHVGACPGTNAPELKTRAGGLLAREHLDKLLVRKLGAEQRVQELKDDPPWVEVVIMSSIMRKEFVSACVLRTTADDVAAAIGRGHIVFDSLDRARRLYASELASMRQRAAFHLESLTLAISEMEKALRQHHPALMALDEIPA